MARETAASGSDQGALPCDTNKGTCRGGLRPLSVGRSAIGDAIGVGVRLGLARRECTKSRRKERGFPRADLRAGGPGFRALLSHAGNPWPAAAKPSDDRTTEIRADAGETISAARRWRTGPRFTAWVGRRLQPSKLPGISSALESPLPALPRVASVPRRAIRPPSPAAAARATWRVDAV